MNIANTHMLSFSKNLVLFLVGILTLSACETSEKQELQADMKNIVPVKTAAIEMSSDPIPVVSAGILRSKQQITLAFKTGGIVEKINTDEGLAVEKGQLLAQLDQTEMSANTRQAKLALTKSKRDLNRVTSLLHDTVATYEQFQNARTAFSVAQSNMDIAMFNKKHSVIRAPVSGKILKRFVEENEMAPAGTPIFLLASTDGEQVVRVGVSDSEIIRLKLGDRATVHFDAYPEKKFEAKVTEIAGTADLATGTFEIEVSLNRMTLKLKNGFVGKVRIFPASQKPYYKVPYSALVEGTDNKAVIYLPIFKDSTARRMEVKVAHIDDEFFAVNAARGKLPSKVISEGAHYLDDKSKFYIVK